MARKFYGEVGFVQSNVEVRPGVYDDVVTERKFYGDVTRNSRGLEGEKVNPDISVSNSISILADNDANENIFAMRYIKWMGTLWIIDNVEVESPRLILRLGGVYNGPRPQTPAP